MYPVDNQSTMTKIINPSIPIDIIPTINENQKKSRRKAGFSFIAICRFLFRHYDVSDDVDHSIAGHHISFYDLAVSSVLVF